MLQEAAPVWHAACQVAVLPSAVRDMANIAAPSGVPPSSFPALLPLD